MIKQPPSVIRGGQVEKLEDWGFCAALLGDLGGGGLYRNPKLSVLQLEQAGTF